MTATDITTMPLTDVETTRLLDLESIVTAGMRTFIEVGNALGEISGSRLYRQTHMTFAAYVRDTFEYGESHAYRLMDAAKMAEIVSPVGEVSRESHARALAGLGPAQARDVWQQE